ncbi:hypothetical protein ADN00_15760 [Ornatilinea apprima]|uniref:Uncharacterized protein n=1 Tax=Ornatilinea apprima TaxID=1134406 RepID=A0A0P6WT45_9CHLR|nr:LuxR C-terminal-related transcriptional regulator [Ornatilinea apprima]KPL72270.1 hypothetical protein ADN00_15760 [Ornatilinea apprima]
MGKPVEKKTAKLRAEERRKVVAANILAGLSYRQIADALNISIGTISNDVKKITERLEKEQVEDLSQALRLEIARLDQLLNTLWSKATNGDLSCIDRILKISDQRAKLLGLYDANFNINVTKGVDLQKARQERWKNIAGIINAVLDDEEEELEDFADGASDTTDPTD